MKLTGQALANKYAEVYAQHVSKESGVPASKCNIWATYIGGGWIEICGSGVPARRDMQTQYPSGWTLLDKKRSSYVRNYITKQTEVEA